MKKTTTEKSFNANAESIKKYTIDLKTELLKFLETHFSSEDYKIENFEFNKDAFEKSKQYRKEVIDKLHPQNFDPYTVPEDKISYRACIRFQRKNMQQIQKGVLLYQPFDKSQHKFGEMDIQALIKYSTDNKPKIKQDLSKILDFIFNQETNDNLTKEGYHLRKRKMALQNYRITSIKKRCKVIETDTSLSPDGKNITPDVFLRKKICVTQPNPFDGLLSRDAQQQPGPMYYEMLGMYKESLKTQVFSNKQQMQLSRANISKYEEELYKCQQLIHNALGYNIENNIAPSQPTGVYQYRQPGLQSANSFVGYNNEIPSSFDYQPRGVNMLPPLPQQSNEYNHLLPPNQSALSFLGMEEKTTTGLQNTARNPHAFFDSHKRLGAYNYGIVPTQPNPKLFTGPKYDAMTPPNGDEDKRSLHSLSLDGLASFPDL